MYPPDSCNVHGLKLNMFIANFVFSYWMCACCMKPVVLPCVAAPVVDGPAVCWGRMGQSTSGPESAEPPQVSSTTLMLYLTNTYTNLNALSLSFHMFQRECNFDSKFHCGPICIWKPLVNVLIYMFTRLVQHATREQPVWITVEKSAIKPFRSLLSAWIFIKPFLKGCVLLNFFKTRKYLSVLS